MSKMKAALAALVVIVISGLSAPAEAARIDLEALGLAATPYLSSSDLLFFGDALAGSVAGSDGGSIMIGGVGTAPFAAADFILTLDDFATASSLTATGTQLGLATDSSVLDILFLVDGATGDFAALNGTRLLATLDDPIDILTALSADPAEGGGVYAPGSATLATLAPVNVIPLPATLPLMAGGVAGIMIIGRRRTRVASSRS